MKEFVEKLIGRLEELKSNPSEKTCRENILLAMQKNLTIYSAIEIVNQLAEEYNNGWIDCSERLPELEADVLLSLRSLDVYTGFRANTEGCFYVEGEGYVELENVLAWQPLPAPFKKGE